MRGDKMGDFAHSFIFFSSKTGVINPFCLWGALVNYQYLNSLLNLKG
jgi:hypothetical protein